MVLVYASLYFILYRVKLVMRRILFAQSSLSLLLLLFCATSGYCARLVDFQVAQPPPLPLEATQCTVLILQ